MKKILFALLLVTAFTGITNKASAQTYNAYLNSKLDTLAATASKTYTVNTPSKSPAAVQVNVYKVAGGTATGTMTLYGAVDGKKYVTIEAKSFSVASGFTGYTFLLPVNYYQRLRLTVQGGSASGTSGSFRPYLLVR